MTRNTEDYLRAAQTPPTRRTEADLELIADAYEANMTDVTNADFKAQQDERIYGPGGKKK